MAGEYTMKGTAQTWRNRPEHKLVSTKKKRTEGLPWVGRHIFLLFFLDLFLKLAWWTLPEGHCSQFGELASQH